MKGDREQFRLGRFVALTAGRVSRDEAPARACGLMSLVAASQ